MSSNNLKNDGHWPTSYERIQLVATELMWQEKKYIHDWNGFDVFEWPASIEKFTQKALKEALKLDVITLILTISSYESFFFSLKQ